MNCPEHGEVEPRMLLAPDFIDAQGFMREFKLSCCPICRKVLPRPDIPMKELTDEP